MSPNKSTTPETPETPEQKIARLEAALKVSNEIIEGQAAQLQVAEASSTAGRVVVTHDKKHYAVLAAKFDFKGVKITAEELKTKGDVVKELVESESGLLQLLTKEEAAKEKAA